MTTAYSPLLGLALPVTGELSGTWGTIVNDSITSLLDSAISGTTTLSSDADVTLTTTTGAANTSREAILLWTAGGTVTRTITVPAQSKIYTVINASSSTQSIKVVGVGPTAGVTIIKGESALIAWNGSDFVKVGELGGDVSFRNVTVASLTDSGLTSGRVTYATTAGLLTDSANLLFNGTTLTANTLNLTNALGTAYGGTGLTSFTANQVFYASSTSAFAQSSNLQFSGTDLTVYGLTVGRGAGAVSTNTAVGASALSGSNTAGFNVAVGNSALAANTSGQQNTAVGSQAGLAITTGSNNTAIGRVSMYANTVTGSDNSGLGLGSLYSLTSGGSNTAVGSQALSSNTTASNNTAVGYQAGYTNVTGQYNTFVGFKAGYTANTTLNSGTATNTFVGTQAGYFVTTGYGNTFIGCANSGGGAGYYITTGNNNTILGGYSGNQGGLDIRTSSNNVVLSDGDGNIAARWANGGGWYQLNNSASWSTTSDARIKENVATISNGLDVVMALRPVEFDYKISKQHTAGFIAQEYEAVLPDQIIEDANISHELKALTNGEPVKGIQQNLVPYLVSAIQALKAEFDAYKVTHP